jgi:hypothetical protein
MPLGLVLYESGAALRHIYFPTDSIVSLLYVMQDGASAEIAVVGNEGAVGVSLFMGGETTPSRAIVQSAGSHRLTGNGSSRIQPPRRNAPRAAAVPQSLITQMAQNAVCNRHHSLSTSSYAAGCCCRSIGCPNQYMTEAIRTCSVSDVKLPRRGQAQKRRHPLHSRQDYGA